MIIGICGLIGSGKDTVAQTLIDKHNFVKTSFADRLKDLTSIAGIRSNQLIFKVKSFH